MQQPLTEMLDVLACPETGQPLELVTRQQAEAEMGAPLCLLRAEDEQSAALEAHFGAVTHILRRKDRQVAYAVVDGIPILMAPEQIGPWTQRRTFDLKDPRYAEAYAEMEHYNQVSGSLAQDITRSEAYTHVARVRQASPAERASFPAPPQVWLDAVYDSASQWDAYKHIAPLGGRRVMQLGGQGIHAVKFLLGGAEEAWLVTPMLAEARFAVSLAEAFGVESRLRCVVAIAEELPLQEATFDVVYSGGCVHHMVTSLALPEAARVLKEGGRFAAIEPWRAPLYSLGTRIFGKREENVFCRPLDRERVAPLQTAFGWSATVQHGTFARYFLIALKKLGVKLSLMTVWRLIRMDDSLASLVPGLRRLGSSIALLGTKVSALSQMPHFRLYTKQ
ncbi:MAG: methyltransferase domain-containing protein [Chloroflexota bacterium]